MRRVPVYLIIGYVRSCENHVAGLFTFGSRGLTAAM